MALDIVRKADHRRFRHAFMQHQRAFDFRRSHAVARHVNDVVHPARDPVIAVRVPPRAVAGRIFAGEGREIGLKEAVMIAPDRPHLPRPASCDDQIALGRAFQHLALGIDDLGHDARHGQGRRSGFQISCAGHGRDHRPSGFRLPPGVDDRAAILADHMMIPAPGFGIDRLANRAEQAQRCATGRLHMVVAFLHQRAQRRGGGEQGLDLVAIHDLPDARGRGMIGHAFIHQRRRPIGERPINNIAVACDPADIGGAPIDVPRPIVEA